MPVFTKLLLSSYDKFRYITNYVNYYTTRDTWSTTSSIKDSQRCIYLQNYVNHSWHLNKKQWYEMTKLTSAKNWVNKNTNFRKKIICYTLWNSLIFYNWHDLQTRSLRSLVLTNLVLLIQNRPFHNWLRKHLFQHLLSNINRFSKSNLRINYDLLWLLWKINRLIR